MASNSQRSLARRVVKGVAGAIAIVVLAAGCGAGTIVGSQQYPVPAGAIVVSPSGNDAAAGTVAKPVRTLKRAVELATPGSTIVLRAGEYHESVVVTKTVTIQNWPEEAVWLDGSVRVSAWSAQGGRWRHDGWTWEPDTSPTYFRGAPDSKEPGWQWINPAYPMAAHPDQIFVDDTALQQVGSLAAVVGGTFFHDRPADRLWIGTNPAGKVVRVSKLSKALSLRAPGIVVRGIGIRRYAPSVPDMGAVTVERSDILLEHVAVLDSATTGIGVGTGSAPWVDRVTLRYVDASQSGLVGIGAAHTDHLTLDRVKASNNNTERFNRSPVAGGTKITRGRHVTVTNSVFHGNFGSGLWLDESVHDATVVGNQMSNNWGNGVSAELGFGLVFADNIVTNSIMWGLKINNTSWAFAWNNTFVNNGGSIWIVEDERRPGTAPGRNPRHPNDPAMTWRVGPAVVSNNVFAEQHALYPNSRRCLVCVEDLVTPQRTGTQMGVSLNGNVYHRPTGGVPQWIAYWRSAAAGRYETWAAFRSGTGQEANGRYLTVAPVDASGKPTAGMPAHSNALPIPDYIAARTGQKVGLRHFGVFPD